MEPKKPNTRDKFDVMIDGQKVSPDTPFHTADSGISMTLKFPKYENGTLQISEHDIPKHIIVVDICDEKIEQYERGYQDYTAKRHFSLISKNSMMNFFTNNTGKHKLVIIILSEKTSSTSIANLQFHMKKDNRYSYGICNQASISDTEPGLFNIIGYKEMDIIVPETALAEVPKEGFEKFFFGWVNEWWGNNPYDECNFKWRAIFMLLLKFPLWEVPLFIMRMVISFIIVIISQMVRFGHLFFGYDVSHYFDDEIFTLKNSWKRKEYFDVIGKSQGRTSEVSKNKNRYVMFGKKFQVWISPAGFILNGACLWLLSLEAYLQRGEVFMAIVAPLIIILISLGFIGENAKRGTFPYKMWYLLASKEVRDETWTYDDNRRYKIKVVIAIIACIYFIHSGYSLIKEALLLPPSKNAQYELTDGFLWSGLASFVGLVSIIMLRKYLYSVLVFLKVTAIVEKITNTVKKEIADYKFKKREEAILLANKLMQAKHEVEIAVRNKEEVKKLQVKEDSDSVKAWNYLKNLIFEKKRQSCKPYAE